MSVKVVQPNEHYGKTGDSLKKTWNSSSEWFRGNQMKVAEVKKKKKKTKTDKCLNMNGVGFESFLPSVNWKSI